MAQMVDQIGGTAGLLRKTGRYVKELEYSSRRGLFDRVYPAAIMTDVKYNLLPMAKRLYPDATDRQIAALVARQANMKYSTLLRSQSMLPQFVREVASRALFSVNENEALLRQITMALPFRGGPRAKFWRQYWLSAGIFFLTTSNLIHMATTGIHSLIHDKEFKPEHLPLHRWTPFVARDNLLNFGYNNRFLSPDLPITTRSGERATLEMLGQLDTAGRLTDFQSYPLDTFISARLGATARSAMNYLQGEDFYGRKTDESGYLGKVLQFAYDIAAPIGFGEGGVSLARNLTGNIQLPEMGGFIHKDTTLKDVLPVSEEELGPLGLALEATGENLKAPTNADLERRMINNYAASGAEVPDVNRLRELDSDVRHKVETLPDNKAIIDERGKRTRHQADIDQVWAKFSVEKDDLAGQRRQEQLSLDNEWTQRMQDGDAWEPTTIKRELSKISLNYRAKIDYVNQQYGLEPEIYKYDVSLSKLSQQQRNEMKLNKPLAYAEQQYYELLDKYSEEAKAADKINIDWSAFEVEFNDLRREWGEELTERFDTQKSLSQSEKHSEFANEYYTAMNKLSGVNWWGDEDSQLHQQVLALHKAMPKRKDGTGLLDDWLKWLEGGTAEKQRIEKNSAYAPKIKMLKARRSSVRHDLKMNDPELDRIVIKWFRTNPVHMNNLGFYFDLYKTKPSRLSTPTGVGYPKATIITPR